MRVELECLGGGTYYCHSATKRVEFDGSLEKIILVALGFHSEHEAHPIRIAVDGTQIWPLS